MENAAARDERQIIERIIWRIMPLVVLMYLAAIIDRANVGFAKLQMVGDLKMSEAAFGLGSSLFFVGYLLFEIPSTLAVHKFGARIWFARIMMSWGVATVLLAFAFDGVSFAILRILLGIAEAGLYPGAIYYLTLWFPQQYQTRVVGFLTLGSAFGNMFGSLMGGPLLDLNGLFGLAGWQWVFLVTGLPPIVLTGIVLWFLPNRPSDATFLSAAEKAWLTDAINRDKSSAATHGSVFAVLRSPRVLFFSFLYILILVSLYGVIYWLPTVVKGFGVSGTVNGLLSALPWLLAAIMLLWLPGRLKQEKIVLTAILLVALLGLVCFAASILVQENWMRLVALTIGTPCISLLLPCFWSLPYRYFKGAEAATSIAAISTVGNLGGFLAQNLMPWVAQTSGSPIAAMMVPAICLAGLAFCAALMRRSPAAPATMTPRTV